MTMTYDRDLFAKFRALAITDASDLVVGKTYYGNMESEFILARLLTEKEFYLNPGLFQNLEYAEKADDTKPKWMLDTEGRTHSLTDSNIGMSYNPWLIFDDKGLAEACERKLKVTFASRYSDSYYCHDYSYYDYDDRSVDYDD